MSKADWIYLRTTNKILKDGSWDTNEIVRPKWEDGIKLQERVPVAE